jgi:hypothetical protein
MAFLCQHICRSRSARIQEVENRHRCMAVVVKGWEVALYCFSATESKELQRTCNIEIERDGIETVSCQCEICMSSVEDLLSLASG